MKIKASIILLHYTSFPVVGGVEEVVRQQALLFSGHGHNVKIITGEGVCFDPSIPVISNTLINSNNHQIITLQNELIKYNKRSKQFETIVKVIEEFLSNHLKGFDFLIAHNVLTMQYNLPLAYALHNLSKKNIVKIIAWCHDSLFFYKDIPKVYYTSPYNILRKYNDDIYYVTISESRGYEFSQLLGINNIKVINNGIDPIEFFELSNDTIGIIKSENLFESDLIMLQPSRLHPRKNIELSINVTRSLIDRGVKTKLLVTGAFDPHGKSTKLYFDKLKHMISQLFLEDNVLILAGYNGKTNKILTVSRLMIKDLYLISDILFMPSIQEGFGIPLIEAGLNKLPIVCSRIGPFKNIADGYALFFNLEEQPDKIALKIIDYLKYLPTQNFFRKILKEYTWDNIYKLILLPYIEKLT